MRLKTFSGKLSVEAFIVFAVVIDHVLVPDPVHLTPLSITELPVLRPCIPPVVISTLIDANWSIPEASPCPEIAVPGNEWSTIPVNLIKATSGCPKSSAF